MQVSGLGQPRTGSQAISWQLPPQHVWPAAQVPQLAVPPAVPLVPPPVPLPPPVPALPPPVPPLLTQKPLTQSSSAGSQSRTVVQACPAGTHAPAVQTWPLEHVAPSSTTPSQSSSRPLQVSADG